MVIPDWQWIVRGMIWLNGMPPMNSILYYMALNEHHIPASLHMFPNGGHGWGIRYDFSYYQEVKDLILKWLKRTQIID